jgi:hypothetical protein
MVQYNITLTVHENDTYHSEMMRKYWRTWHLNIEHTSWKHHTTVVIKDANILAKPLRACMTQQNTYINMQTNDPQGNLCMELRRYFIYLKSSKCKYTIKLNLSYNKMSSMKISQIHLTRLGPWIGMFHLDHNLSSVHH